MKTKAIDFKTLKRHCDQRPEIRGERCQELIDRRDMEKDPWIKDFNMYNCCAEKCPIWKKLLDIAT